MAGQDTHDLRRFVMRCPAVAAAFHHIIKRPLQLEVVFRALRIGLDPSAVHTCFIYPQAHGAHLHVARARLDNKLAPQLVAEVRTYARGPVLWSDQFPNDAHG